ncbi:hypothetical protein CPC08DRAFT_708470 [Agrocybe pediades]|nr:hypothetical protein CPC08DRAFT_708470 [Agrocybe pediades]
MSTDLPADSTEAISNTYFLLPISRLPPEIITAIFQLNVRDPAPGKKPITPLYLGSICQAWRHLVWSTPILWRDINLHVDASDSELALLREWLLRAGTSPLDIMLRDQRNISRESLVSLQKRVLSTLITRSTYWSSFTCMSLMSECYDTFQDAHFPILKTIRIKAYLRPFLSFPRYDRPPPVAMFAQSPQLTDLFLDHYPFDEAILLSNQIKMFGTSRIDVRYFLAILQSFPRLESAHFGSVIPEPSSPYPLHIVSNNTLSSLRIAIHPEGARTLLDHIKLSSLVELRIFTTRMRLSSITSFITRSGCSLKTFDLKIRLSEEDDLVATFEALPTLVNLYLSFDAPTDFKHLKPEVINALNPTYRRERQPLLPNLTSLEYIDHIPDDCQLPFAQLTRERWNRSEADLQSTSRAVARLQSVKFISTDCAPELREVLLELSSQGMKVEFEENFRRYIF